MNISKYFTVPVTYEKYNGNSNKFKVDEYLDAITVLVRIEGGTHLIRSESGMKLVSTSVYESIKWYWIGQQIKAKDKINGQVVMETKEFYDANGAFIYCEAYV